MPSWKKVIVSGSDATLNSLIVTGSATIGSSIVGASENTLTLGPSPAGGTGEGGQLGLNAPGGTYTSASFIDNWQNKFRILKGTNSNSTALIAQWDIHTTQLQLPAYTSATSFVGTATANLAVDSGGNVITVSTSGGSVFPYTGNAVITGSLTTTGIIYAQPNGGMYFQGGDDAALYDINVSNHMGIYGVQDSTIGSIKLGSGGGIISGKSSKIGIGTTNPTNGTLEVNGNVYATSFTGSLLGTAATSSTVISQGAVTGGTHYFLISTDNISSGPVAATVRSSNLTYNSTANTLATTASWASNVVGGIGVTSVGGTGTVSGISLSGTVTSTGNLTLSGTLSGITNSNLSGTAGITNANLANSAITIAGTSTSLGGSITAATILSGTTVHSGSITNYLPAGTVSGSSQITNIANSQLTNSSITIAGTSVSLGGSIAQSTILASSGVFSGSAQIPNSSISNAQLANSTISGVSLGSTLAALTAGSYLTSAGTYTGNTARTFAVDATSANTVSKVVARDSSGNFSASRITTSGLYGPGTFGGNNPIWQFDASSTGYGIIYVEGSPDTMRFDVSGQALSGTPDFLVGDNYAQINGSTVWHAGNDGASSGLDADLLDGNHASAFQLALTNPVTGTGVNQRVALWSGTTTQTSDANLTFDGSTFNITGTLTATRKSFIIDHPTKPGKRLQYGVLEGPEHSVYVRGRLRGETRIELPDHWHALVHEDSITVNLTAVGKAQDLWVEEITDTYIIVAGNDVVNCFYSVFAERKDIEKLVTEFDKE